MKLQEVVDLHNLEENRGIKFIVKQDVYEITGESDKREILLTRLSDGHEFLMDLKSFAALATYCEVYQTESEKVSNGTS